MPETWTDERERCRAAGVPDDVAHEPKWKLALGLIRQALDGGIRRHVVLADAGYGDATEFREGVEGLGLHYAVGVCGVATIWRPGVRPAIPDSRGSGRPPTRPKAEQRPVSLSSFAREIGPKTFRTVSWREGSKGRMRGRFAAFRIYSAERHTKKTRPALKPIWLVIEETGEEKRPFKLHFSNLPESTSLKRLVSIIKLRWRVERDYQDMKQEVGLDSYEGRTWRGFHHHAALCAAAHTFLALRRALFPPKEGTVDIADGAPPSTAGVAGSPDGVSAVPAQAGAAIATLRAIAALSGVENAIR